MSSVPMPVSFNVAMSADSAQLTVDLRRQLRRRIVDRHTELLLECIAAAYSSYHQSDSPWAQTRYGAPRLRLVGRLGSELPRNRPYISVDLEDFQ